ncbi:MAG: low-specificity L-threonine aldolase [Anaerolineales bacterium]
MTLLDFRSDTVTQPTPQMRAAMAAAPVGDDVYGEDPTVNRLQEMAADKMGKEAALYVPSGTMGNVAAVLAHCARADEVILGNLSHLFLYECGSISALGGVHPYPVPNQPDGTMRLEDIQAAVRTGATNMPTTRLVVLENTHNRCVGASLSADYTRQVADRAHAHGLSLHIDGARIFTAAAVQGVPARQLAAPADSVTFCLSKGLSAPVGSVLCGSKKFIQKASRVRKQLGGGMRQAGVIAAAGIVALETMTDRLVEDHRRAEALAAGLQQIPGIEFEAHHTNMVYYRLSPDAPFSVDEFIRRAKAKGLLIGGAGGGRIRMVTHYWLDDEAVEIALDVITDVLGESGEIPVRKLTQD